MSERDDFDVTTTPIQGWTGMPAMYSEDRLLVGEHRVMMAWEQPYMHRMVRMLHEHGARNILEVGFGMGISATEIQRCGALRHTIIEAHPAVLERAREWRARRPGAAINLVEGFWEDAVLTPGLGLFDGIFFDTFSLTQDEADQRKFHFFRVASERLLEPGGALTFCYFNEVLVDRYQRHLYRHFSRIVVERMIIEPPADADYLENVAEGVLCILAIK
jgi:guanidinoacetate N-methyltransferase